jgi:hypothetical protein
MVLKTLLKISTLALILCTVGCGRIGQVLNPFYEPPQPEALLGERNDNALNGGKQQGTKAREALEAMASYRRAQAPQPNDPVIQPAVVRLMWIPDHLNKNGDLVPQHYYYLKVLKDRWAVTDAFDLEQQLNNGTNTSNVPYAHAGDGF